MQNETIWFIYIRDEEVSLYGPYEHQDGINRMEDFLDNDPEWDSYTLVTGNQLDNILKLSKSDAILI